MDHGRSWRTPVVVLVCGGLILMLALGTRQSFGLFLRPMTIDLGCGREVFSFAIALQNLVWGLGMPLAGAIADRYGAGRVLSLGGLAYGLGLVAMAHSATPLELDATTGLLIGLGLTSSFFVCGFQTIFIMTHLPAYAVDRGLSATQGMTALATIGFFNIIGSTAAGALGGRYSKKWILAWLYALRAAAIAIYIAMPLSAAGTYVFAAVLGATWLATVPLTNSLVAQIFGVKFLSTLFSIAFLGHQLGAFVGAWAGGAVFDLTGSYLPVWLAAIALSVIAAALCMPIDERAIERKAFTGAA